MTELQALLTLGTVTIPVALLLFFHLHRRLNPTGGTPENAKANETDQIPVRELAVRLPSAYVVESVDGATVVSFPSTSPLWAVFAGGVLMGGAYTIQSFVWLLASSIDRGSALVGMALGLVFVAVCGYVSWPALFHKRLRARLGRLSTEWSLPVGPALWVPKDSGVTRLIVRHGRWKTAGSTDQVVIDDGVQRYVAETIWNLPAKGSFRWFSNWKVGESSSSSAANPITPWSSVSPVVLALAGQLANALDVPVFFEIGRGWPPLISLGGD